MIASDEELLTKQYSYSCGKAFLKYGHRQTKIEFPLIALRGLLYGLATGQNDERSAYIREKPPEIPVSLAVLTHLMTMIRHDACKVMTKLIDTSQQI